MASFLKSNTFSTLRARHLQGLPSQPRRQLHVEPGAREKAVSHYLINI
ncbi:hypothetical protein HanPI659440_Chr16g0625101 [Helianthus annuus]|nr:hypothetical protein HanPI659440_Chr16g0625101 [Helianthus annuus]